MISLIFGIFILLGILFSFFTGNFGNMSNVIVKSATDTFNIITGLFPLMALWLGIMNIAFKSGLLKKFTNVLKPLLKFLFPNIDPNHESLEYISSNIIMNMFGLGNAATPFGLKAMNSLQKLNKNKEEATRSMITFLVINTCGVTLIPTTIISIRMMHDSTDPTSIVAPTILVTTLSLIIGLIIDRIFARRNK